MEKELVFFLKGLILGFAIAAPTGPIGILCARRTLAVGRRAGFASGMGAATADVIYGFIAAFGVTFIADMLVQYQSWLRLAGGSLLCFLGVKTFIAKIKDGNSREPSFNRFAGMYTSTFFLTLTNPMTVFSFAAVFAGFGLAGARGSSLSAGVLVLGVFLGSAVWWLLLVGLVSLFKRRVSEHQLLWVNKTAGVLIAGTGVLALLSLKW